MATKLMTVMAAGIAQIRSDAIAVAREAAIKVIEETPSWDIPAKFPHKVYYETMANALAPHIPALLDFAKQNGHSDVAEMYQDGLITNDEFLAKLALHLSY